MKAIVCHEWGGPEKLVVEHLDSRAPGPGELKVRVRAAGVNFPDVLIIQKKYQLQPSLPFTPGAEIAGEVLAVGEGVRGFAIGDRVVSFCGIGGFAEEACVPAAATVPMPPGISFELAAVFSLAYGTSWHALRDRAGLRPGETLLVLGAAGGVGLAAVEIGKAVGARVIAAASSPEKLAVCREHGADGVINYHEGDLRASIKAACGGQGPDVIFDPVGGHFAEPAFRSIAWRGRYLVVGFADGEIPALPLNLALLKGASLVGVFWGEFAKREPGENQRGMAEMLGWIREGRLKPRISRVYALEEAPQALMDMAARRVVGKIAIRP